MSYTREQRMANANKASEAAARAATAAGLANEGGTAPESAAVEPQAQDHPQERNIVRRNPVREASLNEIEDRQARVATEQEAAPKPSETPDPAPAPVAPKPDTTPEPLPMAEPVKMAKVKVDGEEFEVPQADIDDAGSVRAYQTQRAAENRLRKTNEALAEMKRMMTEQRHPAAPAVPVITDDAFIQSKMDSIRFGTPEESAAALREVIARANPRLDENLLITKTNTNMNHDSALAKFRADYQDVATNPVLSRLVPQMAQEALSPYIKNGQPDWSRLGTVDFHKIYSNIGNQIRSAVPRSSQPQPSAAAPGTPIPAQPDKEARKASIVNLPTAAARAALPEEEKPESREQILDSMRKARKIPTG